MKLYKIAFFLIILTGCNDSNLNSNNKNPCEDQSNNKLCLTEDSLNIIYSEYKDRLLKNKLMDKMGGFSPNYYPAEVISSVFAIGIQKHDQSLINWSNNQIMALDQTISLNNGYLIWPDKLDGEYSFGSNSQSRLVLSLALLYEHTGDIITLSTLNKAFNALDSLPKTEVKNSI